MQYEVGVQNNGRGKMPLKANHCQGVIPVTGKIPTPSTNVWKYQMCMYVRSHTGAHLSPYSDAQLPNAMVWLGSASAMGGEVDGTGRCGVGPGVGGWVGVLGDVKTGSA